eukprot:gene18290-21958_t
MGGMAKELSAERPAPLILLLERPAPTGGDPAPSATPKTLSNNHLGYALTWYGLAAALAGVYIAYLRRQQVLLAGLAPDGGLYVPKVWPSLSPDEIASFAHTPYAEIAARILKLFAGDAFTTEEALALCRSAYASFDHPAATPLVQLDTNAWLMELYRGPTLAFKDVAMQLLARLYDAVLTRRGETMTLVA